MGSFIGHYCLKRKSSAVTQSAKQKNMTARSLWNYTYFLLSGAGKKINLTPDFQMSFVKIFWISAASKACVELPFVVVNDEQSSGDYLSLINHPEIIARNTGL